MSEQKRREAGVCPVCNKLQLQYGEADINDEGIKYDYVCDNCNFEGVEWYNVEFSQHLTREGKEIE